MQIEQRDISQLIPYAKNSRIHSDEQVAQIAASIREFGFNNPVLVDGDSGIIAGHGRVLAARKLGLDVVPVIELSHMSESQKRAYVIADNRLALNAGWDNELLSLELGELQADGFDLSIVGFSDDEISAFLADKSQGLTDPDETPDAPENPVSVLGDVWLIGKHRIVCGDCTDALVVDKALNGVKPHLMVTDPPYGVEYDPSWRAKVNGDGPESKRATGTVLNDDRANWSDAWSLFTGDVAYVWHAGIFSPVVAGSLEVCGFNMRALIIWAKQRHTFGRGHYHHQHEPCWYDVKKTGQGHWSGDRKQSTLWQIDNNRSNETGHSTQKPVECMRRPVENNSSPGQAVYEPFSGSGTTIIACEETGRACHAIELNPSYVDVAVIRWQNFTGKQATLEGDGSTFDEIASRRSHAAT